MSLIVAGSELFHFGTFRSISLHLAEMKIEVSLLVVRRGEEERKERKGIHREKKKHSNKI